MFNHKEGRDLPANYVQPDEKNEKFILVVRVINQTIKIGDLVQYFKTFGTISYINKKPVSFLTFSKFRYLLNQNSKKRSQES